MTPVLWRRSALGDVVLVGAVTKALGDCVVVTAPAWVPVVERMVGVRRVVAWPKDADLQDLLDEAGPGRHVDLQASLRSWRTVPADARVAKRSLRRRLRLLGLPTGRPDVPHLYAEACGVEAAGPPWFDVSGPKDALALIPGASNATKQWGGWRAVAEAWDGPVLVFGGPGDEARCGSFRGLANVEIVCESGFDRTFAALGRVRVAAGGDTGLLHLAAASGASVVGIFGPTHPDDGFFPWERGEVVQRDLWCRPCSLHGRASCPLGHHRCMDLPSAVVLAAIRRWW